MAKLTGPPVSARILEIIGSDIKGISDTAVLENIVSMACVSWNMAVFKKLGQKPLPMSVSGGSPGMVDLVEDWAGRKERLYPGDMRLVLNCDMKYIPAGPGGMVRPDVVISSVPAEACFMPDGSVRKDVPSGNVLRWEEV
jgi:hypothetical protein